MFDCMVSHQIPTPRTSIPSTPIATKGKLYYSSVEKIQDIDADLIQSLSKEGPHSLRKLRDSVPFKTSIATITFNGTVWEKLDAVSNAGFDGVEIMPSDLQQATPQEIYQYCKARNLNITVLQPFRDLEGYNDQAKFDSKLKELEDTFSVMAELHTDLLLCCSNCLSASEITSDENTIVKQLSLAADLAAKHNVSIAYENLSWATHTNTFDKLCRIVKLVNKDNFGICIDTFHINVHVSLLDSIDAIRDKIFLVQYCDAPILSLNDKIEYARNYRVFPGQGEYANLVEKLQKIYECGYKGCLSLEVFNKSFREDPGKCSEVADDGLRGLLYLEGLFCNLNFNIPIFQDLRIGFATLNKPSLGEESRMLFLKDLTLHMDQLSHDVLKSNCELLGYSTFFKQQHISTNESPDVESSKITRIILHTNNRLEYNRQCLFVRSALGMLQIPNDKFNLTNDFGLPSQMSFGYPRGGIIITLKLNSS